MPGVIPNSERQLVRFLNAVRHVERRPATDTKRGRTSCWRREDLVIATGHLRDILERETSGRVSLNSFIGQYFLILDFPSDVQDSLADGRANLQEAAQLARLMPERLGYTPATALGTRGRFLGTRGRAGLTDAPARPGQRTARRGRGFRRLLRGDGGVVAKADELLEVDPTDARHLFREEMKRLFYAMKEVEPEDIDEETMDDFLAAMDGVSNVIFRIERRRQERHREAEAGRLQI